MCDKDVSKDVTCAPNDYTSRLMGEVERLQAENASLHEELADWQGRAFGFKCACESLIDALYKVAKD